MPKWYFSKDRIKNRTPSRTNGVDFETECRYRREGCRFIMDMGNKLGLRYDTMATGVIYFHRFYMKQSFKTFPRWVTACACLFLAGKVEETPKKCRDIVKVAKLMLSDHHFQLFGENPREEVMMYERVLLHSIKFDLQVEHPYAILLKIGKLLKGDKGKIQKLVQMAWTFVNDSLSTNLCIRSRPEILAIAHLNLAGKLANFDLKSSTASPSNKPWWLTFNKECSERVVDEICNEMLELYGGKKKPLKEKVTIMKKEASPSNISPSTSSPSVGSSPPTKRQRINSKSRVGDQMKLSGSIATKAEQDCTNVPTQKIMSSEIVESITENSGSNNNSSVATMPPFLPRNTTYTVPPPPPPPPSSSFLTYPNTIYPYPVPTTCVTMSQTKADTAVVSTAPFLTVDPTLFQQNSPAVNPTTYSTVYPNIPPPPPLSLQPPTNQASSSQILPMQQSASLLPPVLPMPAHSSYTSHLPSASVSSMNIIPPHMVNNSPRPQSKNNQSNWRPAFNRPALRGKHRGRSNWSR